jgi:hypothetical protein
LYEQFREDRGVVEGMLFRTLEALAIGVQGK